MKPHRLNNNTIHNTQSGQSMVEYMVVVSALILALYSSGAMDGLIQVLKDNYEGYSYAISISDYPD